MNLKHPITTSRRYLCWRLHILLVGYSPRGTIEISATSTNPSIFYGRYRLLLSYCIHLYPMCWQQHLSPFMPMVIHWIYWSSFFIPNSKQGSQYDSLLFRIPNQLHSSHWTTISWSSASKTILSKYCCMNQLAWELHLPWHCTCNIISCLIQQCFTSLTLQGRSSCYQISHK